MEEEMTTNQANIDLEQEKNKQGRSPAKRDISEHLIMSIATTATIWTHDPWSSRDNRGSHRQSNNRRVSTALKKCNDAQASGLRLRVQVL
jgi:hypothetical protein